MQARIPLPLLPSKHVGLGNARLLVPAASHPSGIATGPAPSPMKSDFAKGPAAQHHLHVVANKGAVQAMEEGAASAVGENEKAKAEAEAPWEGAKPKPLLACILLGLLLRFAIPVPAGLSTQGWSMVALFASTIAGIVLSPLPPPGVAFCALCVAVLSGTYTFAEGVASFTDEIVWLVVIAFFFASGFSKTGLGNRIAFMIVSAIGSTTLGLAYGLNLAETVTSLGMPSAFARSAGIFFPIGVSVAKASGSDPAQGTEKRMGRFLIPSMLLGSSNSASLLLTCAGQNLLCLHLAAQVGFKIPNPFMTWVSATSLPTIVAMICTPLLTAWVLPPEIKRTPEARDAAREKLRQMGKMSRDETVMAFTVVAMVILWAGAGFFNVKPVVTACIGISVLMLFGTVTWEDCLKEKGAWTTFIWFSMLISMASMLNKLGVVEWLAHELSTHVLSLGLSAGQDFVLLLLLYNVTHYLFASQVAHVGALFQPILVMMIKTGTPPSLAIIALAASSNFFAAITPYASAQALVSFNGGYVKEGEWYRMGLIFLLFQLFNWVVVGGLWWKALGLY